MIGLHGAVLEQEISGGNYKQILCASNIKQVHNLCTLDDAVKVEIFLNNGAR